MSKFKTVISVDVDSITAALPPGHHVSQIFFNEAESRVEVHWEHDLLQTPLDHAIEFPLEFLRERQLPKAVRDITRKPEVSAPAPVPIVESTESAQAEDVRTSEQKPVEKKKRGK